VRAVAMTSTDGVVRGMEVVDTGNPITVPVGQAALGRILNVAGRAGGRRRPDLPRRRALADSPRDAEVRRPGAKTEVFETGIKVIDLIAPFVKGGKIGLFGGAGVGKTVIIQEADSQRGDGHRRPLGVLRRGRADQGGQRSLPGNEGERRAQSPARSSTPDERAPRRAAAVGLTGLTVAEYFRDVEGQDVLVFIDNIFRFTQAGSEVSALLGRMPSAVGYQPTLATEMGELQERITSTKKGSITSVQAIYVPADDLNRPGTATAFSHLERDRVLSRQIFELGIYPPWIPCVVVAHPGAENAVAVPGR